MRNLSEKEVGNVSGGGARVLPYGGAASGLKVIWDGINGDAPGPSALTGTASGPTPGNVGGRYPVDALGDEPSANNIPGGQLGRAITNPIIDAIDFS